MNLLIVEDDPITARALARIGAEVGVVHGARDVSEAQSLLGAGIAWAAMVLDLCLPDGSGLDVLARARQQHPATPAALFTGTIDYRAAERARRLGARWVAKGMHGFDPIRYFLRAVAEERSGTPDHVLERARAICARSQFSGEETAIAMAYAQGLDREDIASAQAIAPSSVRAHEENACKKTGDLAMGDLVARLFREAARESRRTRPGSP